MSSNYRQWLRYYFTKNNTFRSKTVFIIAVSHTDIRNKSIWLLVIHRIIFSFFRRPYLLLRFANMYSNYRQWVLFYSSNSISFYSIIYVFEIKYVYYCVPCQRVFNFALRPYLWCHFHTCIWNNRQWLLIYSSKNIFVLAHTEFIISFLFTCLRKKRQRLRSHWTRNNYFRSKTLYIIVVLPTCIRNKWQWLQFDPLRISPFTQRPYF